MEKIDDLAALIARHAPADGAVDTPIKGLGLLRSSAATEPVHTLYEPSCCIVAQGRKRAVVGGREYRYDPSNYLIVGLDLPVIGAVIEASVTQPYLSVRLPLNRQALADMLTHDSTKPDRSDARGSPAIAVEAATPHLIDAATRLLHLLDTPDDIPALAPLIEREILYRLLRGPHADMLRQVAYQTGRINRIQRAIAFIRHHFTEDFAIDELAALADMSVSTFHAQFKAATHMSPLRFRAQIRLQEARRLMLAEGLGAAEAGFRVGYESPSQFSREYGRLFNTPPKRDAATRKALASA
ncbi:MAG: AraC family transcriptional regulator [Burkholderia sp.]|jgi:AraC-like DNA-binding protein|nr:MULTISPECIES: AraC family transcriptional regulator [Burkholderia]MBY8605438.1 AraC family transcriptional regulator [Burkholderia arboris]MCA3777665.1 AraC family transcriptional regulator [Burkholderia sp.]MCA3783751.1 AraC family transcriptional regulator [Burkholderia sp.]MCA3792608.1 AraC family transcriptional regulator [Burkholderia sp.]MCA3806087.1 AraC family transcriptional regulator [Burkholderia sp.]